MGDEPPETTPPACGVLPGTTSAKSFQFTALAFAVCLAVGSTALALRPVKEPHTIDIALPSPDAANQGAVSAPLKAELQKALAKAVTATEWPTLNPSIDAVLAGRKAPDDVYACASAPRVDVAHCSWGPSNAPKTAAIVGDSMSVLYAVTLRKMLADKGPWRVTLYGGFGCPVVAGTVKADGRTACPGRAADALKAVKAAKPDLLFVSDTSNPATLAGHSEDMTEADWAQHMESALRPLKKSAGKVVILAPPPSDKNLADCYTPSSTPADCVGTVTSQWHTRAATDQTIATQVGGTWIDSSPWFCFQNYCPPFADHVVVKFDESHMTGRWAEKIAPVVAESLRTAKVL